MQKKVIALAVAGLVSGVAFAQTNVTIYGIADAGYVYGSDSYTAGAKSTSKVYSGGQSGSRLGFKGTEDLGNGLAANFRYEAGINIDGGTAAQNGGIFSRWSTVGLSGKSWGEFQIGRRDTFMDEMIGGFDATGRNTVSQAAPIMRDQGRYSNMIAYLSPNWSGFQVKAGVSTNGWDAAGVENENTPLGNVSNVRILTGSVAYINGPLKVGATYERSKAQSTNTTSFDAGNQWVIAGAYDFKVVAISAEYGVINNSDDAGIDMRAAGATTAAYNTSNPALTRDIEKRKQWTVGAMVPIGSRDRVGIQYARGTNEFFAAGKSDEKAHMWGLNYFHDLSKRTNIYAGYGNLSQDSDNTVKYGLDGQGSYQKGYQVGLRHTF